MDYESPLQSFSGFCPIAPVPKGRPRFMKNGHAYTPKETREYEELVRKWMVSAYGRNLPMGGSLQASYEFVLPRRSTTLKSAYWSSTKPDIDNFVKAFQDAMDFKVKRGGIALGVIENDSRISCLTATKRFAFEGEQPGTFFCVEHADDRILVVSDAMRDNAPVLSVFDGRIRRAYESEIGGMRRNNAIREVFYVSVDGKVPADTMKGIENKFPDALRLHVI